MDVDDQEAGDASSLVVGLLGGDAGERARAYSALEKDGATRGRRVFALKYHNARRAQNRAGDWTVFDSEWGVPSVASTGYRANN